MDRFDIAIVGSGPGGVSAAITAKIRKKSILFLGKKNLSEKVYMAHRILNYPGLANISGEDLGRAYEKQLDSLGIEITERQVSGVYSMGNYFGIQAEGEMYEASTVILATGMSNRKLLEGENVFLGRGVSYCATCDAQFYRGKKIAVVGQTAEAEPEVAFLAEVAGEVLYFPEYEEELESLSSLDNVSVLRERAVRIQGGFRAEALVTEENRYEVDGIFLLRETIAAEQLVPGLAMDGNHIAVNLQMETNLPGCFACGDVAGKPYQYIKAAGQGNVAALSAVDYLNKNKL
ncbi:MAG: NAD(P)/FAD-dependent oxidoreductase [Lachnospiraceae bacterium]|nr:NAD(P)/FAD-dependent oxidoreductase [Lachnospiraceae bacterium]MDD6504355.1 NAD(P)/FAD-dependent oxidoreductase [Lachnospiraceae bacterium]